MDCLNNERAICRCGAKSCSGYIGSQKVSCLSFKQVQANTFF